MKTKEIAFPLSSVIALVVVLTLSTSAFAQVPSATPDQRGIGVESRGQNQTSATNQQGKEAKPELVLQTGYSNFFGATSLVFSPDGRLLATATFAAAQ
jgi:hypothetical protein